MSFFPPTELRERLVKGGEKVSGESQGKDALTPAHLAKLLFGVSAALRRVKLGVLVVGSRRCSSRQTVSCLANDWSGRQDLNL